MEIVKFETKEREGKSFLKYRSLYLPLNSNTILYVDEAVIGPYPFGEFKFSDENFFWFSSSNLDKNNLFDMVYCNFKPTDEPHSPNLFLHMSGQKLPLTEQFITLRETIYGSPVRLYENKSPLLSHPEKCLVKQILRSDNIGITRFSGVPIEYFHDVWRKPFGPGEVSIYGDDDGSAIVVDHTTKRIFRCFIHWFDLQQDWRNSTDRFVVKSEEELDAFMNINSKEYETYNLERMSYIYPLRLRKSTIVMDWMNKNCSHPFYLFSDYTSMFSDPGDEFCYITDVNEFYMSERRRPTSKTN